ncbi:interferon-induced transmembrane protein 1-like isoform 1-T2 [Leptodactylus fuscus]|uniref:interferon-induced transmembrane protein 1-like n=1 Tax=Leptodactylus fuscus TaxID=238119 RepID=UPI003F4F1219
MENNHYGRELNVPPPYVSRPYEPLKEEVEFRDCAGQSIQSTVVTIMAEGPPVRDHIIWSFFNTMFLNFCCLGFLAFVFSVKSRDRKLLGDRNAALSYGSTARSLNIATTVLSILTFIIGIIIFIFTIQQVQMMMSEEFKQMQMNNNGGNMYGK